MWDTGLAVGQRESTTLFLKKKTKPQNTLLTNSGKQETESVPIILTDHFAAVTGTI